MSRLTAGRIFSPSWSGFHGQYAENQVRSEWAVVSTSVAQRMKAHFDGSCASNVPHEPDVISWTRSEGTPSVSDLPDGSFHTLVRVTTSDGNTIVGMSDGFEVRSIQTRASSSVCDGGVCNARWAFATPGSGEVTNYYSTVYPDVYATRTNNFATPAPFDGQLGSIDDVIAMMEEDSGNNLSLFAAPQSTFWSPTEEFDDIIADENDDDGLTGGQIAGITIGCVIAALLIILIIVLVVTSGGQQRFTGSGPSANREGVDA
eukprot:CAMPEP_0177645664 /NCGR_PEP_ID=MMETSP0447-20121125/9367_1 /TAXON_ID=0 /ORGANISM="Stygamoeba regulata, Strain BSH-02190019" /LENGTH=259 /DNA_ID=CAMNT_0019148157 /DNA_START=180 /DNA_END=959 /DNA_ORIENTATION=+